MAPEHTTMAADTVVIGREQMERLLEAHARQHKSIRGKMPKRIILPTPPTTIKIRKDLWDKNSPMVTIKIEEELPNVPGTAITDNRYDPSRHQRSEARPVRSPQPGKPGA